MLKRFFHLAILLPFAAAAQTPVQPQVTLAQNEGFCPGMPAWSSWEEVAKPPAIQLWTSVCGRAASGKAVAVTTDFRAPAHLTLYLFGWMKPDVQGMWLENVRNGEKLAVRPAETPRGGWERITFDVPRSWRTELVRLRVETLLAGRLNWVGFSEPFDAGDLHDYRGAFNLLSRLSEYYLLLSCLFFAAVALAIRRGFRDPSLLLFAGLAGTGVACYLSFWLWFLAPKLARPYSVLMPLLSVFCLIWLWKRIDRGQRNCLFEAAKLWQLAFWVALFVLAAGFLFGDVDRPIATPQSRFSHQLPMDNFLQYVFSEQIINHHVLHPMIGGWLSSDRPPLQTAFTLFQLPFVIPPRALAYTVLSVLLQSFWAPALWAFLRSLGVLPEIAALALIGTLFSGFVLVNNFFVWPKLLAAAYMLGCSILLLAPRFANELRRRRSTAVLAGSLFALGMLSHGGTAFALLGLIATLLVLRRWPPLRTIVLSAGVLVVLYLPWVAYQKFSDPPGDRLLKMHLAGVDKPTMETFPEVLHRAYEQTSLNQIVAARRVNAETILGPVIPYWRAYRQFVSRLPADLWHEKKDSEQMGTSLRAFEFQNFVPALGLYMFGPAILFTGFFKRFRNDLWQVATTCWIYVLLTVAIWCLVLFSPGAAINHQGAYVANLLALAGGVLAFAALSRWLATIVVSIQSLFAFYLYVIYLKADPAPGVLAEGVLHRGELILLVLAFFLLAAAIVGLSKGESCPVGAYD